MQVSCKTVIYAVLALCKCGNFSCSPANILHMQMNRRFVCVLILQRIYKLLSELRVMGVVWGSRLLENGTGNVTIPLFLSLLPLGWSAGQ